MKKLLGISMIAVLAVSPMMAGAAVVAGDPVSYTTQPTGNDKSAVLGGSPLYQLAQSSGNDGKVATAGYVKGAYNAAIKAVNKVADMKQDTISDLATIRSGASAGATALQKASITTGSANGTISVGGSDVSVKGLGSAAYTASTAYDAAGAATNAVNALDTTVSKTAGADGLAISVTQTDGKITSVTGSIASGIYDASGAASGVQSAIETKLGAGANGYAIDAKSLKVQGTSVLTAHQDISGKADKATTLSGYGITDAYTKTQADSAISSAVNALDATASQTAASTNGNLALSITETNGKITAISGSVTHPSMADYAKKEGTVATIKKATGSKTGVSLGVSGTPTGTIANTVTQGSISTTVSVPTSGTVATVTDWTEETAGTASVSFTNTNKTVSANVTGANVTSTFTGTGITSGTATGNISDIAISVGGYYENASDTTAETF